MKSRNMRDGKCKRKTETEQYVIDSDGNKRIPPPLEEIQMCFELPSSGEYVLLRFIINGEDHTLHSTTSLHKDQLLERAASLYCYRVYGSKIRNKHKNTSQDQINRLNVKTIYNKWIKSDAWDNKIREVKELLDIQMVMDS